MTNHTEYMNKLQAETIETIKHAQDASLATFASMREFAASAPSTFAKVPTIEGVPNPTELVEQGYAFAGQLLELQKSYALKVAELIAGAQKQAVEAGKRVTKAAKGE